MSVAVTPVNDDPTNAGSLPTDIAVIEDVLSNVDLSAIDLADVDAAGGDLTLTLTTGTGGNLTAADGTGITIGGTSTALTISGSLTDLNSYLNNASNIHYLHATGNFNGSDVDTIRVDVTDNGNTGSGGGTDINLGTLNVDITAVDDVPQVAVSSTPLSYTEQTAAVVVDGALTLTDIDGGDTTSGTVSISEGFVSGDSLNFTNQLGINGSYDSGTGILTLNGATSAANYQTALRSITFDSTSDDPGSRRVITFVLDNGIETSDTVSRTTILDARFDVDAESFTYVDDIFGTGDPAKADGTYEATGGLTGGGLRVYLGPGANPADVSGGWSKTVNLASDAFVSVVLDYRMLMGEGYESDEYGEVVLEIDGVRYGYDTNTSLVHVDGNGNGGGTEDTGWLNDEIHLHLTAGSHTFEIGAYNNKATAGDEWVEVFIDNILVTQMDYARVINVTAINDDPTNDGSLPTDITVTEDVLSNVDLSAIDLADVDAAGGDLTLTLTTGTGGNLTAAAGTGITIGGTSTALTISGSLTDLNSYLNTASNINYLHATGNFNGNDADTIRVDVTDNGNTGSGGGGTITLGTSNVDITAVNDTPTISAIANQTIAEDGTTGALAFTVGDVETAVGSLTVSATSSNTTIIPNGNLTLVNLGGGSWTIEAVPASNQNGGPTTITVTVADGTTTTDETFTVTVTAVNDAPVGLPTINGIVTEDQILSVDTSGISDIDGLGAFQLSMVT